MICISVALWAQRVCSTGTFACSFCSIQASRVIGQVENTKGDFERDTQTRQILIHEIQKWIEAWIGQNTEPSGAGQQYNTVSNLVYMNVVI